MVSVRVSQAQDGRFTAPAGIGDSTPAVAFLMNALQSLAYSHTVKDVAAIFLVGLIRYRTR
ncbi:hypothetical protein PSJ59_23325 [Escherichia coli]|uniref:hypothetical protein n=1 Tax=Escherichia coli TaxID=562 RepID=UPI002359FC3A|nr:hypothetical protein [Escherichia coli]MDC9184730.1 hypothetical protein [Escherichia coli]